MEKRKRSIPFTKILIPVDFSSYSQEAIDYGSVIGKKFNAGIILMHVIEALPYSVTDSLAIIGHRRALETIAKSLLQNLSEILREKEVSVSTFLARGAPHREILRKAERERVDLIVMGTHGRTGLEHLVLGSVAEKVVRLSACPVLTVRLSPASVKSKPSRRPRASR